MFLLTIRLRRLSLRSRCRYVSFFIIVVDLRAACRVIHGNLLRRDNLLCVDRGRIDLRFWLGVIGHRGIPWSD